MTCWMAEGMAVAADIAEAGGDALYVHLDVTSEDDWREAIQAAVSNFGKLNVLVNNAAIWRRGRVEDTSVEDWDAILDVNAKGVFLGTKLAIEEMRKAGGGSIINISSTAGLVGSPRSAAYNASKGAVRLFTKATAIQYGREGIRGQLNPSRPDRHGHDPRYLAGETNRVGNSPSPGPPWAGSARWRTSLTARCSWRRTSRPL